MTPTVPDIVSILTVLSGGFLSTVQDSGRLGYAHLGISPAGAADSVSFRLGNLLVGNPPDAPAIEMTLVGSSFRVESHCTIAITGSDFGPMLDGIPIPLWQSIDVSIGQALVFGGTKGGARCYLSIAGGFFVPPILNSASTHVLTHLGGFRGRGLRSGDTLTTRHREPIPTHAQQVVRQGVLKRLLEERPFRVTDGPQVSNFSETMRSVFFTSDFMVMEDSNRMGLRLSGPAILRNYAGDLITEGVSIGAVQIPPDGQPILLFVEHPTTGGYPKIASVISADIHQVGQLRPRDTVRFEHVTHETALALLLEREALLQPQNCLQLPRHTS
jgi:antagonist of KipI